MIITHIATISTCFPCSSDGKESACNVGDLGLMLVLGRSPGEGKGYPLLYSGLENSSRNQDCQEKYQQPQICRWYHSNGRKQRETKEPLDEGERREWKSGLKTRHSKTKIMAFGPITSWQKYFAISWSPISLWMVTATTKLKDNCYLEEKIMTNLNSVLKSRDITLLTKVLIVKAVVVPVVMFGCESWTIK